MGIEVLVLVLLSTNILVQKVAEDQYGMVRSGPPFVLVWGTLSQTGWSGEDPRVRKLSGGKFPQRLTTVGG
jgi:hypothetical protein